MGDLRKEVLHMRGENSELRFFTIDDVSELAKIVARLLREDRSILVCIGTELRGDDRAGLELCRELRESSQADESKLVECPFGLEMCIDAISEKKPKVIIVVDAAILPRGSDYVIASPSDVQNFVPLSTHSIPISSIAKFLEREMGVERIVVVGIAAEALEFSMQLSARALRRVKVLAREIARFIQCK